MEDPGVANRFLTDLQIAWEPFLPLAADLSNATNVEMYCSKVRTVMHNVAVEHFAMRPTQKSMKLLPATFDLLRRRRDLQDTVLQHVSVWSGNGLGPLHVLRWFFMSLQLLTAHLRMDRACKTAVRNDNKAWHQRLIGRLQQALDLRDSREAWAVSRMIAGHGPCRVINRTASAAKLITQSQWEQHLRHVWGARKHTAEVVSAAPQPLAEPLLHGASGQATLLKAALAQPRCRATPPGAVPAELLCLVTQKRSITANSSSWTTEAMMQMFEGIQCIGYNPQAWCDGFGCPIPKPGGASGPTGQRIINLLDAGGKMFYKALMGFVPDRPASHQFGFTSKRSRRDAILQVEAWLDRLRFSKFFSAATLFDLTKAFDSLNRSSIEESIRHAGMPPAAEHLLLDLHRRLRIQLPLQLGGELQVHLESGVLQGGGTGPRIFRMAYDDCVEA